MIHLSIPKLEIIRPITLRNKELIRRR